MDEVVDFAQNSTDIPDLDLLNYEARNINIEQKLISFLTHLQQTVRERPVTATPSDIAFVKAPSTCNPPANYSSLSLRPNTTSFDTRMTAYVEPITLNAPPPLIDINYNVRLITSI